MDYKEFIDSLIRELSYRVGVVDLNNKHHISELSSILSEWSCDSIKDELISILVEAPTKGDDTEGEDKDYFHIGRGFYVKMNDKDKGKDPDTQKYTKEGGTDGKPVKMKPVSHDKYVSSKDEQGDKGEKAASNTTQNQSKDTKDDEVIEEPRGTIFNSDSEISKEYSKQKEAEVEAAKSELEDTTDLSNSNPKKSKQQLLSDDHRITDTQLNMTKSEAKAQAKEKGVKHVGAGTAESRAGEAMVHKGIRLLKGGKSLEEVESQFKELVSSDDHILNSTTGKQWVNSSIATLTKINEIIDIENIQDVVWDTSQGREAIGVSTDLKTSADMFIKTNDGKNTGISLKKTGMVFLNNGGWAKQSELLLESLRGEMSETDYQTLSDAMSIDAYKKDLQDRFSDTTKTITPSLIESSFERLKQNEQDQKEFKGSNRDKYFKILENPTLLIKKINLGTANVLEQKAYAKLLQTYHTEEYNHLRKSDNGLTERTFNVLNNSVTAKQGMNRHIIKSMHIPETIGLSERFTKGGVDEFITIYGIEPDGAALNEQTLITLLGSEFKQKLDDVRDGISTYTDLENFIVDSIEIDYPSGQILFRHESNKKYPLFKMTGRSRGIGASPVMELVQTSFMAHALKMGTFNTDEWDEKSLKKFQKDIIDLPTE